MNRATIPRPSPAARPSSLAAALAAPLLLGGEGSLRARPTRRLELVQTIVLKGKAGKLDHLALDAKRDRLFVANKANNTLDVLDLKEGQTAPSRSAARTPCRAWPMRPSWIAFTPAWARAACATSSMAMTYKIAQDHQVRRRRR